MGLILKLLLLAYALDSSSQSTTESLTFQTERECVSNGGILLDGDSLILYFDYGFNSSVVVSLRCSRGGDIMLTSIGESKTVTDVFAGRVTFDFNETGIIVNMIASVQEGDSDIATFQCEVVLQLSTGSLISRSATATITSQQYGNITQQDVSGRINLLNEQIYELPSIITVQTKTGGGLFECMPASLVDVKDDSGAVMCTGVTSGSNSFCNFTLGEEDISDQENKTFTACATLYDTDACKSISVFYNDTRPDDWPTDVIIGLVVGIVLGIIVIIVLIILAKRLWDPEKATPSSVEGASTQIYPAPTSHHKQPEVAKTHEEEKIPKRDQKETEKKTSSGVELALTQGHHESNKSQSLTRPDVNASEELHTEGGGSPKKSKKKKKSKRRKSQGEALGNDEV